ncbi:MAG: DUF2191 domain-containing protein, partial [Chloroflexi bacterium]|nr:DUF2191 domain-containing protein [Chloroflexota bacterium]
DDELLKEAKGVAEATGRTLAEVVEDALRESLARRRVRTGPTVITLPTFKGSGLCPGVDLDNSAALLDLMSSPNAAP